MDKLALVASILFAIGFAAVLFSFMMVFEVFGDNSTRKDWGGDDKGKYCTTTKFSITIYANGTSEEKTITVKTLCKKDA